MNKVIISGRTTRAPEISTMNNGDKRCAFTLAVRKNAEEANFINCVAWKNTAEKIEKYVSKGKYIAVIGNIENRSFTAKDGSKRNVTEVIVQEVEFIDSKAKEPEGSQATSSETLNPSIAQIFEPIENGELPF